MSIGMDGKKALLVRTQAGETVRYSGKLDGQNAEFSVTGDTVTYCWGEETYSPYQVKRDPTALAVFTVLYVLLYKQLFQARVNRLVKDGEQAQPSDISVLAALGGMLLLTGATLFSYLFPLTKLTPI